jgi:hypothetical protein
MYRSDLIGKTIILLIVILTHKYTMTHPSI